MACHTVVLSLNSQQSSHLVAMDELLGLLLTLSVKITRVGVWSVADHNLGATSAGTWGEWGCRQQLQGVLLLGEDEQL